MHPGQATARLSSSTTSAGPGSVITDGVAGAISACRPHSGTDLLAASAAPRRNHRRRGDPLHGQGDPEHSSPRATTRVPQGREAGYDLNQVLTTEDLVSGENVFFATGVTDGDLLKECVTTPAAAPPIRS